MLGGKLARSPEFRLDQCNRYNDPFGDCPMQRFMVFQPQIALEPDDLESALLTVMRGVVQGCIARSGLQGVVQGCKASFKGLLSLACKPYACNPCLCLWAGSRCNRSF